MTPMSAFSLPFSGSDTGAVAILQEHLTEEGLGLDLGMVIFLSSLHLSHLVSVTLWTSKLAAPWFEAKLTCSLLRKLRL